MVPRSLASLAAQCRRLAREVAGGIGVIAALALPAMLGAAGLAYDANRGLAQRVVNQRAADLGALGAAMAYQASRNGAILQPTARDIAVANGLVGATITADLVENYPAAGDRAVRVSVATIVPSTLSRVVGAPRRFTVSATATASLAGAKPSYAPPCLLALSGASDAFVVSGGASISAPTCSAAAVGSFDNQGNTVAAHDIIAGGGSITNNYGTLSASSLRYAGSFNNPSWNANVPAADKRVNAATALTDPWAASSELAAARALIGGYTAPPPLADPATASPLARDYSFDWSPQPWVAPYRQGTSGTYVLPTGTYYIGRLSVAGGVGVSFGDGSTIYIDRGFGNGGSSVNFGNSNVYVNGGFDSGSSGVTIGAGTLAIGSGKVVFAGGTRKGDGAVMINATAHLAGGAMLVMGAGRHRLGGIDIAGGATASLGAGDFVASTGVAVAGGGELSLGDGDVLLGPSGGTAISLAGSARFFMGDGAFSANGAIATQGGSRLAFGRSGNHLINGAMTIAGSVLFGAGRYTLNGDFTNGTGGTTWPYTSGVTGRTYGDTLEGTSVGGYDMAGVNVTFVLAGTLNLAGGARTRLVAATASTGGAQIADMLLHSLTAAETNWTAGSSNNFAGTVYLPNSKVTMSGGNTTLGAGQCFTLIASRIAAAGGTATGTACATMSNGPGGGAATIRLLR